MATEAVPTRRALRARARHEAAGIARARRSRGRHATGRGEGFGRLVTWTTLGAAVPGVGFLIAGRRRTGLTLLALIAAAGIAGAWLLATGRLTGLAFKLAVRPDALLLIAAVAVVAALVWAVLIVTGHRSLRRGPLRMDQNVLATVLVGALVAAVVIPGGTVARYAMAQRSVVLTVFDDSDRDADLAAPDTAAKDPWIGTPRINVLLIGSDSGDDRQGTRPDTLITASIDTATGDTVLFSLPRNLENAPFPRGTPGHKAWPRGFNCEGLDCHINGVWTWAEANSRLFPGDDDPGLTATRQVVGEILGLQLDYYALVNLQGFEDLVNALGGLEINVQKRVPVQSTPEYERGLRPTRWIEKGRRVLNGEDALWFARSRAGSDNYERMRRQQCVLGAAAQQIDPIALARSFPALAASAERNISTDIPQDHLEAFVVLAQRVQGASVQSLPFTNQVINASRPDFPGIRAAVQEALLPPPPAPAIPAPGDDATDTPAPTGTTGPTTSPSGGPSTGSTSGSTSGSSPSATPDATQAQDLGVVCG